MMIADSETVQMHGQIVEDTCTQLCVSFSVAVLCLAAGLQLPLAAALLRVTSDRNITVGDLWLQRYYWFKRALPIWTEDRPFPIDIMNMVRDTLDTIRPKMHMCANFEQAVTAVQALEEEYKAKICEYTRPVHVNTQGQCMSIHKAKICEYTRPVHINTQSQDMGVHKASACQYTRPVHVNTQGQDMRVHKASAYKYTKSRYVSTQGQCI